jgi:hypothetical protein
MDMSESSWMDESGSVDVSITIDDKKAFYKKCLSTKLTFNSHEPVQYMQVSSLYQKAIAENVSKENWESFILENLMKAAH